MRAFIYSETGNVGDTLTRPILEHFLPEEKIESVPRETCGKLIGCGSILQDGIIQENDVVFGSGIIKDKPQQLPLGAEVLAVRGKLTRELLRGGGRIPEIYGDPALLLPLLYRPEIAKTHALGIVPHYADKVFILEGRFPTEAKIIDISRPWREFVEDILCCERIVSSSLHGIVIAEAYGIPATWAVYSDRVIGKGFKFRDYFSGTGRKITAPGEIPPIENLEKIQKGLVDALLNKFKRT